MTTRKDYQELIDFNIKEDLSCMEQMKKQLDLDSFLSAVNLLCKAGRVYVIGIRNCSVLADYLAFHLNFALDNVIRVSTNSTSELIEQMLHMNGRDVVVGISFPRYSKRTLRIMEFANSRQAQVISITDSINSPMCMYSSCNLFAAGNYDGFGYSLTTALSFLHVLIQAIFLKKENVVREKSDLLEQDWSEFQVYSIDELEFPRE